MTNTSDVKKETKEERVAGVGVLVANSDKVMFYLQRKDNEYPIQEYRGKFSFWGGGVRPDESVLQAQKRELWEELRPYAAKTISDCMVKVGDYDMQPEGTFTLYEAVLSDDNFRMISQLSVNEGIGLVVPRHDILKMEFVYGLEEVMRQYIEAEDKAIRQREPGMSIL